MKIKRFIGRSVNGHLNFDIRFLDQLTFITGINGSGKTSALNSIAALLLPRLDYLAGEYFELISLEILDNDKAVRLSATKTDSGTVLSCSLHPDNDFAVVRYEPTEPFPPGRAREYEEEYYEEYLVRHAENPVLGYIQSLPTPMYLGLDRRSLSSPRDRARYAPRHRGRADRNIFGRSLEVGLGEALGFARDHMQEVRVSEAALDAKIREKIVLELIGFPPVTFATGISKPSKAELTKFEDAKVNLSRLPSLLSLPESEISNRIDPTVSFLDDTLRKIQENTKSKDDDFAVFEWSFNKTNLDKLSALSEIISEYNSEVNSIRTRVRNYLDTVNKFIHDSGKEIVFNKAGVLRFVRENEDEPNRAEHQIYSLSSGEIQLVVILTHLYFNPEVEKANVFIIDEPELSLHVQWQQKFVDGIIEASEETQFILATHSPTIILDRLSNCRELSPT